MRFIRHYNWSDRVNIFTVVPLSFRYHTTFGSDCGSKSPTTDYDVSETAIKAGRFSYTSSVSDSGLETGKIMNAPDIQGLVQK